MKSMPENDAVKWWSDLPALFLRGITYSETGSFSRYDELYVSRNSILWHTGLKPW